MEKIAVDGLKLKEILKNACDNLKVNSQIVNELNVFPIPDGDTGTNMSLTLNGGLKAIENLEETSVSKVAKACADGMLMNARGNSGVILSQLFYGFAVGLQKLKTASIADIVTAFESGVKTAYKAVDNPTEGTILTVAREATEAAAGWVDSEQTAEEFVGKLLNATNSSVQETPEKLAVLKEAGVVDSGGAGLYYIIEGVYKHAKGQTVRGATQHEHVDTADIDYSKFNEDSELEFGYCSEVLLQLQRSKTDIEKFDIEEMRSFLNTIGDSIVLVQTGSVIKVHVHTFTPYKLLEHCQKFGEFLKIKIENMTLQNKDATIQNNFQPKRAKVKERTRCAIVAVASGDGLIETFKSLGASVVISGGQTNNPSAEDFVEAFNEVNAEYVFVLPNNSNIILTAKQAAKMFKGSKIYVIESKSIGDGYSAISMADLTLEKPIEIAKQMKAEMKNTKTGMITTAVRSTKVGGVSISQGDYIGMVGKKMLVSLPNKIDAINSLIDNMNPNNASCLILVYGKSLKNAEKRLITQFISTNYPELEYYEIEGGQDVYDIYAIMN